MAQDGTRRGFVERLPAWSWVVIGVVAVVVGAVIAIRPTTSLGVLALLIGAGLVLAGVLALFERHRTVVRVALAAAWVAAGVLVLLWPGLTVRMVILVVGAGLVVNGVVGAASAFRGEQTLDARAAAVLLGVAGVVFGVLALTWPDITLLVVGLVFGAWLVITGAREVLRVVRGSRDNAPDAGRPPLWRRWLRTLGAVAAVLLAVVAGLVSAGIRGGSPVADEFYAAPRDVPADPGRLIRAEVFERGMPDDARAWRILYTTTDLEGDPAVASGLVIVPRDGSGDWPVIDWTHGTTGFDRGCAPSILPAVLESGAFLILDEVIDHGWAIVATDYLGLGTEGPHPYLIGLPSGRAALDAVRAARELDDARLGDRTVVWGHSQGGGAALWTGAIADAYAPDVELAGVAALAPAANLPGMVENLTSVTGGSIFASFVAAAYSAAYPDVTYREYIRPGAEVIVRQLATRCLAAPGIVPSLVDLLGTSQDPRIFATDPGEGPLGQRLRENIPPATTTVPVLLAQGASDGIIVPAAQDEFVASVCAAGMSVDYRRFAGLDHMPLVEPDSRLIPQLLQWTEHRFAGMPVEPGCVTTDH